MAFSNISPVIAVVGGAGVDVTLRGVPGNWIEPMGLDIYTAATVHKLDQPVQMVLGGNGGAAAYVMARLGAQVELNAPIGHDGVGVLVRQWLENAGVELITPHSTSTMVNLIAADGDGKRVGTLQYAGLPIDWKLSAASSHATWLLVAAYSQVTPDDFDQVCKTLHCFKGRVKVLDSGIGWMQHISLSQMHEAWGSVDLLVGTIEELAHWTGCQSPRDIAAFVSERGPRQVVIKMGDQGAAWQEHDQPFMHQPACELVQLNITVGAGDGFNGGLLTHLSRGESIEQAVTAAQQVAAKVVQTGLGVMGWGDTMVRQTTEI